MGILSNIQDAFFEGARSFSRRLERDISRILLEKINQCKRQMAREMFAAFIMLLAIALLSASSVFFLIEYIHLTKTLAFLIIGVIVLLIGILVKLTS